MKLKTLKELDLIDEPHYWLQQEAIKHFKAIAKGISIKLSPYKKWQLVGQMVWIQDFFNISEEDLKSAKHN